MQLLTDNHLEVVDVSNSLGSSIVIAERLSARLLIVHRSQLVFVCMYIYIYVYPSHFDYVGAVSVVSSPDY